MPSLASPNAVYDVPGHRERLGIGLGLRWEFLEDVLARPRLDVAFWEVSPENHMRRGGYFPWALSQVRERYPLVTHGLTMSLGAVDPPPAEYLAELKAEIQRMGSPWHSDHLCLSTAGPVVLHDLLPLRFSTATADRTADRLCAVQDALGVPMAFENISWYAHPGRAELPETEFINRVLERSGCWLLLDVNNVYVNARNHAFDAYQFISELPLDRVIQLHVAGHTELDSGLLLDTHGAEVCDPVFDLLRWTLERSGPRPVLLERDNNVPELDTLLAEVKLLQDVYASSITAWQSAQRPSAQRPSGQPSAARHPGGERQATGTKP
jgi:uncharacterized protein (UPF0276 family)